MSAIDRIKAMLKGSTTMPGGIQPHVHHHHHDHKGDGTCCGGHHDHDHDEHKPDNKDD